MPVDVIMPALGMSQDTGRLIAWRRREGEAVVAGEALMEIETDKATVEVEAPASGTLARVMARPGDEVPVGRPVAVILLAGEADAGGAGPALGPEPARAAASPRARREAARRGFDLSAIAGSGPGGAVKFADLPAASVPEPEPPPSPPPPSGVWATMARRTAESWTTVPHFFLERECDAGRLRSWLAHAARSEPATTYTDLLIRLAGAALARHPLVNGRWDAAERRLVANDRVDVGVATAVEQGLVVPVVAGADRLTLAAITARRRELVDRARAGRLGPEDLRGATFTITNLGMFAVDAFSAIVDAPQAAILAVGRIADRVVAEGGRPEVRPTVRLTLSCDHRAVDGARAAAFLTDLGDLIEEPAALL
ncbi:MAG TPA: dihydrolipoamide acetyltransferase family protein [Candidatus Dormibacteraeota bacterium]